MSDQGNLWRYRRALESWNEGDLGAALEGSIRRWSCMWSPPGPTCAGKVVWFRAYESYDEALADAGIGAEQRD